MDKELLLCVFVFFVMLGAWAWIREDFLKDLTLGFGGAVMMGLRVGMRSPDQNSVSASSPASNSLTSTKE